MITEFKPKGVTEKRPYSIELAEFDDVEFDIEEGTISVEILASGDGASPIALDVSDVATANGFFPDRMTAVRFQLAGGTPGVRYLGMVTGTMSVSPALQYERHFQIEVHA